MAQRTNPYAMANQVAQMPGNALAAYGATPSRNYMEALAKFAVRSALEGLPIPRSQYAQQALHAAYTPANNAVGAMPVYLTPDVIAAVQNTLGARLVNPTPSMADRITMNMSRRQLPQQAGEQSIRSGVFFSPEQNSPFAKTYTGKYGYGGPQKVSANGDFENPIMVKAGTGGRGPELAFDQKFGKGSYQAMRTDVLRRVLPYGRKPTVNEVAAVLSEHGGDPNLAGDILRVSNYGNQLPYAIQENIVANRLLKAGHDAVIAYTKTKNGPRLSEVFDLTRKTYPEP